MKNPFKEIISNEKLPDLIRAKVLDDVELVKLTLDLADLIAIKYPGSLNDILRTTKKRDNQ